MLCPVKNGAIDVRFERFEMWVNEPKRIASGGDAFSIDFGLVQNGAFDRERAALERNGSRGVGFCLAHG